LTLFSLTQRTYGTFILLSLLSFLGNYFVLPLLPGVNFLFGSIGILLIIYLFGTLWGTTVAFLSSIYTVFLWGHPFGILVLTLEALFIGMTWRNDRHNLLLLEGLFWFCFGGPLMLVLYANFLPLESIQATLIILKILVNGIVNAALVSLLVTYLPLKHWLGHSLPPRLSLRQILTNLVVTFILLPALMTTMVTGRQMVAKTETEMQNYVNLLSKSIIADFLSLHQKHITALQTLAQIAIAHPSDIAKPEQQAELITELFPEFLEIVLTDTNGNPQWFYAQQQNRRDIHEKVLSSHPSLKNLSVTEILTLSSVVTIGDNSVPILTHVVPLHYPNLPSGVIFVHLRVILTELLQNLYILPENTQITLTNEQGIVLKSTRPELLPLQVYDRIAPTSVNWSNTATYLWSNEKNHRLLRWQRSFFIQAMPMGMHFPVTLVVEFPLAKYVNLIQQIYFNKLVIVAVITLLGLILATIVSHSMVKPLLELAHITYNLPNRFKYERTPHWPQSRIGEIDDLTHHFKRMAQSLQARFAEIHAANTLLEERVQIRTQELLGERAVLWQSQEMLRLVMDNIPQAIFWKDNQGIYLGGNRNFAKVIGVQSPEIVIGKTDEELPLDEQTKKLLQTITGCITVIGQAEYCHAELRNLATGTSMWFEINKIPLRDAQDQVMSALYSFEDVTERKRSEEKLRQAAKVLENSTEAILITDAYNQIVLVNKAFTHITGYTEAEVLGKRPDVVLKSGRHSTDFYETMWESIQSAGHWEGEIWNRRKSGDIYPEWLHISVIKDEADKEVTHYLAIFSDITSRKQTEQRLTYLAYYDSLTGLANRTLFYEHLAHAISYAQERHNLVAVMFLDLDRFKYVNDTWGHAVGDLLLKYVANRLLTHFDANTVARLGGDDFTILLENLNSTEEVALVAQKILESMVLPFDLNGHETFITTSIGISLYPNDGEDAGTLLKNADTAMYRAKESGKNNYQFFTPQMNELIHHRLWLETHLRHALARDELVAYYQPQMHLASGHIVGAEVLLRWQHPEMGLILPDAFIPLAEETGLIVEIGEWVLRHTCLQHQRWRASGKPILRMAVNLSSRQFRQPNFIERMLQILEETCMDPTLIELELTENMLMRDIDNVSKKLYKLKERGIQLAIDDFGMGYSSLSYLKRFPIDVLKIDKSFLREVPANQEDMAIVKAIIALARSLRLTVIAEGVETKSQLIFLKSLKCDEVQGYFIGRPLPEDAFLQLLGH